MSERPTTEELLKAWDDADIARTHWTGCEWSHAHCAVRRLGEEIADLRRKLEIAERALEDIRERRVTTTYPTVAGHALDELKGRQLAESWNENSILSNRNHWALEKAKSLRDELTASREREAKLRDALKPFVIEGIPDNWPADNVLTFVEDERQRVIDLDHGAGHTYEVTTHRRLSYLGIQCDDPEPISWPTIGDYRRVQAALRETSDESEAKDATD